MKDYMEMMVTLISAGFVGVLVGKVYKYTHSRAIYSVSMETALVIYAIITSLMLYLHFYIGGLAIVGTLTITRFRNPIKDYRDIIYIFWTVAGGFTIAAHQYILLAVGSGIIIVFMFALGAMKNYDRLLLVVKGKIDAENDIMENLAEEYGSFIKMKYNNSDESAGMELIYEIKGKVQDKVGMAKKIKASLYENPMIYEINVICQEDDIAI